MPPNVGSAPEGFDDGAVVFKRVAEPFPLVSAVEDTPLDSVNQGWLPLDGEGCGRHHMLICTGQYRGYIWLAEFQVLWATGVHPLDLQRFSKVGGSRLRVSPTQPLVTFLDWYERELAAANSALDELNQLAAAWKDGS